MKRIATSAAATILAAHATLPAAAFDGRWVGGTGSFEQETVVRSAGGRMTAKLSVSTRGCIGEVSVTGAVGRDLVVLRPTGAEGRECRITLSRRGASLVVAQDRCSYFHGASCEFAGTYRQAARPR